MLITLLKDIKGMGKIGDTITVSDGYAINFLIPQKSAVETKSAIAQKLSYTTAIRSKQAQKIKEEKIQILKNLPRHITLNFPVNKKKMLFNTITPQVLVKELNIKGYGVPITAFKFEPIKNIGVHTIPIAHNGYTRDITLEINAK